MLVFPSSRCLQEALPQTWSFVQIRVTHIQGQGTQTAFSQPVPGLLGICWNLNTGSDLVHNESHG